MMGRFVPSKHVRPAAMAIEGLPTNRFRLERDLPPATRGVTSLFLFPFASVSFLTCPWCLVCVVSRASCTAVLIRSCYLSLYLVVGTLCLTILSVTFLCYLRDITKGFSFFSDCTLLVYWCNPPKLCNIFFLANQC